MRRPVDNYKKIPHSNWRKTNDGAHNNKTRRFKNQRQMTNDNNPMTFENSKRWLLLYLIVIICTLFFASMV